MPVPIKLSSALPRIHRRKKHLYLSEMLVSTTEKNACIGDGHLPSRCHRSFSVGLRGRPVTTPFFCVAFF